MDEYRDLAGNAHQTLVNKITQRIRVNQEKRLCLFQAYDSLSSIINNHMNENLKRLYEEDFELQSLKDKISKDTRRISETDHNFIDNLKIEPFVEKFTTKNINALVNKYFDLNYKLVDDKPSFTLRDSLFMNSPLHLKRAKKIISSIFGIDVLRDVDERILWDSEKCRLVTVKDSIVYVIERSLTKKFDFKIKIEYISQSLSTNFMAVGCQNG